MSWLAPLSSGGDASPVALLITASGRSSHASGKRNDQEADTDDEAGN